MASKTFAEAYLERDPNNKDQADLIIRVPFDQKTLLSTVRNTPRDKKSTTLVDALLVGEVNSRATEPLHVDIGPYRVELRGGVNIYCAMPSGAGSMSEEAHKLLKRETEERAIALAEEATKYCILPHTLRDGKGNLIGEAGARVEKSLVGDVLIAGGAWHETTSE